MSCFRHLLYSSIDKHSPAKVGCFKGRSCKLSSSSHLLISMKLTKAAKTDLKKYFWLLWIHGHYFPKSMNPCDWTSTLTSGCVGLGLAQGTSLHSPTAVFAPVTQLHISRAFPAGSSQANLKTPTFTTLKQIPPGAHTTNNVQSKQQV